MPALANKNICTGCTACASVCPKKCIEMQPDEFGFMHPVVNEDNCVGCALCSRACPVLSAPFSACERHAYAAYCVEDEVREQSSSGGAFWALCMAVLGCGGAVYGAAYDSEFKVVHTRVDNACDLACLRGAKYSQSELSDTFACVLADLEERPVLFAGTPCQTAGLLAYLKKSYENLITVDFICHGVPSPLAWREYVKYRAKTDCGGKMPNLINLRSKISGWSRYSYSNLFEYENGITHTAKSNESPYMQLFVNDYISRSSCESCSFKGADRPSDITLGDFWGVWDLYPELCDDKGISAVITHTKKGRELLLSLENVVLKDVSVEEIAAQNGSLLYSSAGKPEREAILSMIREGRMAEVISMEIYKNKTPPKKPSLIKRGLQYIKRRLG